MACKNCKPHIQQLLRANSELRAEVAKLQVANEELEKKCEMFSYQQGLWEEVNSDYISPDTLSLKYFAHYLATTILKYPIVGIILNLFISNSHRRKEKAKDTNPKWHMWSDFYQSWIADMFLRSRAPKSIRRSTLLISTYLLLGNVSQPCWRLLQRLKIVVSKEVVEKWIKSIKKQLRSTHSFLFHVVDNCDMKLHVSRVRSTHRTEMKHLISRYNFWFVCF